MWEFEDIMDTLMCKVFKTKSAKKCTKLIFKLNAYMVDIVQDGYFLQKLSLIFQLHRLFLSTFGIEPPPSIDFSGQ